MSERDRVFYEMITVAYPLGAEYQEFGGIKRLADAGYRKADEVQKETFSALYKKVDELLFENSKTTRDKVLAGKCKAYAEIKELILETAKECGVEVEE